MVGGFHNCYPKSAVNASGFTDASNPIVHFAAAKINNITTPCVDSSIRTSSNNQHFQLSCNKNRDGAILTAYHDDSLDACIDTCATYTNGTCLGVVFDSNMTNGFENCYLKKEIGVPNSVPNFTFAIRTANNGTSSSSEEAHSSSKAWITGPVVGALVIIALLAGFFLWRRRRRSKRASTAPSHELGNAGYEALEMNEGKQARQRDSAYRLDKGENGGADAGQLEPHGKVKEQVGMGEREAGELDAVGEAREMEAAPARHELE